MSLPSGVINRPPLAAPHPVVFRQILRFAFWVTLVVAPLMLQVSAQVYGVRCRYSCSEFESELSRLQREKQTLLAERERLLAPSRLEKQARRLGLRPPAPGEGPFIIESVGGAGPR